MKKRHIALSLTLAAAMALTTACSGGSGKAPETTAAKKEEAATSAAAEGGSGNLDTSNPITIAVAGPMTGDNSEYGLYVKTVNGETADYDKDGAYWAFYINGEYAMSGVDYTAPEAGTTYGFHVEKAEG